MTASRRLAPVTSVAAVLAALLAGCGSSHIRPHSPRSRRYEAGEYERAATPVSAGSLWQDSSRGLFADSRANHVGDIVTIRVDENPRAAGDASTAMERSSEMSVGLPSLLGFTSALERAYPDVDPSRLVEFMSERSFDGSGETSRSSRVRGAIAVRVKQRLPNGDLFVEGTKILMVNDEELHIYISGVVRPEDIEPDNSVRSSLIADAQIEFTGRGSLTDNQEEGWLSRLLSAINPF